MSKGNCKFLSRIVNRYRSNSYSCSVVIHTMFCVCHSQWLLDIRGAIFINECFYCCLCPIADNFSTVLGGYTYVHTHTSIAWAQLISGILAKNWVQPCGSKTVQIYIHLYSLWALDFQLQLHAHTLTHVHWVVDISCACTKYVCACVTVPCTRADMHFTFHTLISLSGCDAARKVA